MGIMKDDLTGEQVASFGAQISSLLAAFCKEHRIRYVISAAVQKTSDPELGTHFLICSEPDDPMWSMMALVRSAKAIEPFAEAQRVQLRDHPCRRCGTSSTETRYGYCQPCTSALLALDRDEPG